MIHSLHMVIVWVKETHSKCIFLFVDVDISDFQATNHSYVDVKYAFIWEIYCRLRWLYIHDHAHRLRILNKTDMKLWSRSNRCKTDGNVNVKS